MGITLLIVVVLLVAAIAVAAGALDGPRRVNRRRVVVEDTPREVIVERPVATERRIVTEQRDPLL